MLTGHIRKLIFRYLDNLFARNRRWQPQAEGIVEWLVNNAHLIELREADLAALRPYLDGDSRRSETVWMCLHRVVSAERKALDRTPRDGAARRLSRLGEMVGLSAEDIAILELLLRYETDPIVEDLIDTVFGIGGSRFRRDMNLLGPALPALLGTSPNALARRFVGAAPLVRSGLVQVDDDQDVSCLGRLHRLVSLVDDELDVRELLLGGTRESDLEWSDFDHFRQNRDHVENLLRGALQRGARGVNILLHGPPGTGKTEFCSVLARHIGVELFSVGEADHRGREPSRQDRLAELRFAQSLLGEDSGALLLFDEMEDLLWDGGLLGMLFGSFGGRRQGGASKVFMNRLLEDSPAPTLWTTNEADGVNPAFLRRMTFAVEMRQPPLRVRTRIWSRQLAHHRIEATEEDVSALAQELDAPPGVAAGATAGASLAGGDFEHVRRGVRSLARVLGCEGSPARSAVRFDPNLIQADLDLSNLAALLEASEQRQFSLCLQGPPGSGKSAYVRYLADRIGLEVMHKRTSDLLSMWVGRTERNIADAFAEARDNEAFLVFDEADSLLADRRGAHRSWEVTQVNEMLTWMESHPLPFACTTNFGENLDSAALRRFVFKVTLGFLRPAAVVTAFRLFFELEAPPALRGVMALTPADFEVVRHKAGVLGRLDDAEALTAMLRAECDAKPNRPSAIGFRS